MNPDAATSTDWRSRLQPEARSQIVTKILDTFKKRLPISGPEGLDELRKIAVRFEENFFCEATSLADYLWTTRGNGAANALFTSSNTVNQASPHADSIDSAGQNAQANVDLQEIAYQKIKSLKETYFTEVNEMHQKIALRLQQYEAPLLPSEQPEHLEGLKKVKMMLERYLQLLQLPKGSIQPAILEKLPIYEKQICSLLNTARPGRLQSHGQQQFQQSNVHDQPTSQQSQPEIGQTQQPESHMN